MRTLLLIGLFAASCSAQDSATLPRAEVVPSGHDFPNADSPQISVECVLLTASANVFRQLKPDAVIRASPQRPELTLPSVTDAELLQGGGIRLVSARSVVEKQQPIFIETISADAKQQMIDQLQGDERSNTIFAPKVTLFDRQTAQICDTTTRPFVVGMQRQGESFSPQVHGLVEGTQVVIRGQVRGNDRVRLDLRLRLSNINDVAVINGGPANLSVQVPEVTAFDTQASAVVKTGETLAIWGVQRENRITVGTPITRNVPYVSRLFKATETATSRESFLYLITPTIVRTDDLRSDSASTPER